MAEIEPKCAICQTRVTDYTPEYMKQISTKFRDNKGYQVFCNEYKKNPNLLHDKCMKCRILEWQGINYPNYSLRSGSSSQHTVADTPKKRLSHKKNYILMLIVMIVSTLLGYFLQPIIDKFGGPSENKSGSIMMLLNDQFPSLQQGLRNKLNGAFSRLQTPGEPIIFMLLHDDVNKKSTDCLVSYMSVSAKKIIFTNSPNAGLWMNGSEWTHYSDLNHEELIYEELISQLKKNEVLVVENLQDLPWSLAKLLHHLCDSENPTIAKAMYVLELKVNGDLQQLSDGEKLVAAELAMNAAWQDAPSDFREPLIARLTSYVDAVPWKSDSACLDESFIRVSPKTLIV